MSYFSILLFVLANLLTGFVSSTQAYPSNKTAWHGVAKQRNYGESLQHQIDVLNKRMNSLESDLFPTDLIGWTVFQRRMDGSVDFYRRWNDYVEGFGNPTGEFWLGLREISRLMELGSYELRIDMQDFEGNWRYAYYNNFYVGIESANFPLTTSGYLGDAGDNLRFTNQKFSTKDRDHDLAGTSNCAEIYKGAWWYASCHQSNLNGLYLKGSHTSYADGVNWRDFRGYYYSLKYTEMKMRMKP